MTLFKRNPKLQMVQLGLDSMLAPLTFGDINEISNACPSLKAITIYRSDMDEDEQEEIWEGFRQSRCVDATKSKWLYKRGSRVPWHDRIMRKVLDVGIDDDFVMALVDLMKFRKLKNRLSPVGNVNQRKRKRPGRK